MTKDDPYGVKQMSWMQLEFYADGNDPMREKVAHARAEIRRREADEREEIRRQRREDVTRRISSRIELQKERLRAEEKIINDQAAVSLDIANKHLRMAHASAWAAGLAAFATLMLSLISALQFFGPER